MGQLLVAAPAYKAVAIEVPDFHHIIGNKAVAPLYKLQGSLALSYAALSLDKDSHSVYLHQVAVDKLLRSEYRAQDTGQPPCQLGGGKRCHQQRTVGLGCNSLDLLARLETGGENAAWNLV